jgi:NAD(P)-dependent dehydrogenase (short-subunit alcohol dehydrogenase family)
VLVPPTVLQIHAGKCGSRSPEPTRESSQLNFANIAAVSLRMSPSVKRGPTGAAYVASKHGLIGLTTCVSAELAPQGIRVNLVCPGFIDTPMHRRLRGIVGDQLYDEAIIPSVHAKRAGRPEEIAQSILFLCSDEASYITGTTLTPDGGYALTMWFSAASMRHEGLLRRNYPKRTSVTVSLAALNRPSLEVFRPLRRCK